MPRTNSEAVRGIIEGIDDDFDLDPLIETANMIVSAKCASLAYTTAQLRIIETWLTAHLWACDHSRLLKEVIGRSEEIIEGKVGLGLDLTHHGQQLKGIDFLGGLADFGLTRRKVKAIWLGRTRAVRRKKPIGPGNYYGGYYW